MESQLAKVSDKKLLERLNMSPEEMVVIKVIKEPHSIPRSAIQMAFEQELAVMWIMSRFKSSLTLLGYSRLPMALISRHYKLGSLASLIYRNAISEEVNKQYDAISYDSEFILKLCQDIIAGINDIHSQGIMHCDLKSANILIEITPESIVNAVICDYGLARVSIPSSNGQKSPSESVVKGFSPTYAAPESFKKRQSGERCASNDEFELKAGDIFAFGILMVEILNRRAPWFPLRTSEEIGNAVLSGMRPKVDDKILEMKQSDAKLELLVSTMESCWREDIATRPSAEILKVSLSNYVRVASELAE
eukprot:Partr_v1_DN24721_c0_g1_i2_m37191 putative protein kinase kinase kinase